MDVETTYGLKNSYIEAYLGSEKSAKQIPRWDECQKHHNMNFSIPAFFLTFVWYLYKGAYKAGFIFLAAFIIIPNLLSIAAAVPVILSGRDALVKFASAEEPEYSLADLTGVLPGHGFDGTQEEYSYYFDKAEAYEQLRRNAADVTSRYLMVNFIAFLVFNFILRILSAVMFDYIYFRKLRYLILYEMAGIKSEEDEDVIKCLALAQKDHETKDKKKRNMLITAYIIYLIAEQIIRRLF